MEKRYISNPKQDWFLKAVACAESLLVACWTALWTVESASLYYRVSAGACNGLSYMSGQRGRAKYSNIDLLEKYQYIGLRHLLKKRNIMDFDLLLEFPNISCLMIMKHISAVPNAMKW